MQYVVVQTNSCFSPQFFKRKDGAVLACWRNLQINTLDEYTTRVLMI